MRILIISFYYTPDLSAGSFRTTALVEALREAGGEDLEIDVITTLPNRYATYSEDAPATEKSGRVSIDRVQIPAHKSDLAGQAFAFLRFAFAARRLSFRRDHDFVFATSSRLMTASIGAYVANRKRRPLYLDIRDIFVDTIGDLFSGWKAKVAKTVFSRIEGWTMRSAQHINLVSEGFRDYFEARYEGVPLSFHTNGIDDEFLGLQSGIEQRRSEGTPLTVLYAGNIGEGQCLHAVVPDLAQRLAGRAHFVIIGDGGRRRQLEQAIAARGCDNVEIRPPVTRNRLIEEYTAADVLFLHLGAYDAFRKVLPSKIFEYAAMGKPILAGVAGFAAQFLQSEVANAGVFPPSDSDAGVVAFDSLTLGHTDRAAFVNKFARSTISANMAQQIVEMAGR